jgi:hypothetical protein
LNGRLVVCLFAAIACALVAAGAAVAAGWGLLIGLAIYSGLGSVTLVVLAVALPQRVPALMHLRRRPALA